MTVMVIGLGSMGQRRIRLVKKYDSSMRVIGVDSSDERCKNAENKYGIDTYPDLQEAVGKENIECAFISTSPLSHAELINQCLKHSIHVFTELNLVDTGYDENIKLANDEGKVLFLSSTFLYRKEIMYLQKKVKESNKGFNYMYHVGQYLPDWHPWENYKDFFVGQKKTNGCRELFAIELPWIVEVFGKIKSIKVTGGRISSLEIGFPDHYILLLEHENGNRGSVAVDVVSRKAVRNLEVYSEDMYLTWNGTPTGLSEYDYVQKKDIDIRLYDEVDKRSEYGATIIEDAYYSEVENFFQTIKRKEQPKYSFEKDKEILKTIDHIEGEVEEGN
jgi:predicted dehydrogenase